MEDLVVKYKTLKKIIGILEDRDTKPDDDVKFEFIIGSCFPTVYQNIKEEMRKQYTQGYIDGSEAQQQSDEVS